MLDDIKKSFQDAANLIARFASDANEIKKTVEISEVIAKAFRSGNKILACGNGGSACDAMHFCEEFTGRFRNERPALPAISLTDVSHVTCVGNDYGFDQIFAKGVEAFGKEGDILLAISTSGNSKNIVEAVKKAKAQGVVTIGMLGKDGGQLAGLCDYEYIIAADTSDRIQEVHMTILHIIIEGVERLMFPENY